MTAPSENAAAHPDDDPVLRRRAQIVRASATAKRAGYLCVLGAMIVFGVGFATSFGSAVTTTIVAFLVASAVFLIPAMIFGYGARAAEREEAGEPFRY